MSLRTSVTKGGLPSTAVVLSWPGAHAKSDQATLSPPSLCSAGLSASRRHIHLLCQGRTLWVADCDKRMLDIFTSSGMGELGRHAIFNAEREGVLPSLPRQMLCVTCERTLNRGKKPSSPTSAHLRVTTSATPCTLTSRASAMFGDGTVSSEWSGQVIGKEAHTLDNG